MRLKNGLYVPVLAVPGSQSVGDAAWTVWKTRANYVQVCSIATYFATTPSTESQLCLMLRIFAELQPQSMGPGARLLSNSAGMAGKAEGMWR